jgi:hypothetical protein
MKGNFNEKALSKTVMLSTAALVLGLAGSAFAVNTAHNSIVLKDYKGNAIKELTGPNNAFSMKKTCFGATGCHGGTNATGKAVYTYDDIEKHSYHAQIGANEQKGFNPWNPDATVPEFVNGVATGKQVADAWRRGAGPIGKNWVQSPGHVGSW